MRQNTIDKFSCSQSNSPVLIKSRKQFIGILILVIAGFGIGIYLQDLKHQESTEAAWKANRSNLERFQKVMNYANHMDTTNWRSTRDSIKNEVESFMILRFRKEVDSLNELEQKN